ncbi:MAG: S8 family serine peptidase [Anaerolineae bacterium]|nr:S8 family serine peptidase [Anaerolineae bacterium]
MRRVFAILLLLAILAMAVPAAAQDGVARLEPLVPPPTADTGEMIDETPALWFVELASPPAADGTPLQVLKNEKAAFRAAAKAAGLTYTERYAFDVLWNGLSIQIAPRELAKLSRIPGVKAIYPVKTISLPPTTPSDPALFTALAMTGADVVQSELGYTGAGVKVAVMDTGIDYDHPALGGCFGPGCRVAYGYDFVGDAYNADPTSAFYNPIPSPDPYPDDCNGHGTHVAGIIGANGTVKGVAPNVTFGAYRVFGCEGSTTADVMIAAMERALADGMQVLNMSIGSAYQWPQYPTAMASNRLVNKGMVVVASIGNNGANGLYSAGAPGVGEKVIGVASFDNTMVTLGVFTISPDGYKIGYAPATGAPLPPTSGTYPMARTGTPTTPNDACSPLPPGSLTGKVALIRRGTCTFYTKAYNAQQAGAVGVVLYNNTAGRFSPTVAGTPPIAIPVVAISDTEGVLINNRLAAGPVYMTWTDEVGSFPNPTGGLISSFSSYGLSPDLALKPDLGAPGGSIYSTYPLEKGGYATLSGTSMSSPHVAGAVALLLEAKPQTPSQAVRGILQNSAEPKPWWGNPGLGFLDNVHRQGAGMLAIDDAILATTKITPAKIAAGESEAGPYVQTLTLENKGASDVTYSLSYVNALSTGPNTFSPAFYTSNASVAFSAPTVTVPAGGYASVTATINPATAPVGGLYGGYIVFTPQGGGQVYRVPFAGYIGDYQAKQVLVPTTYGFPWLAVLYGGSYYKVTGPADWTFTMQGGDIPYFLVHLDHQARLLRIEIFSEKGKAWHRAYNEEYLPRNSGATSFFAFPFDGTTVAGTRTYTVPDGTYYAVISVLKANGDASNPAHWETWTSPLFVIDRP